MKSWNVGSLQIRAGCAEEQRVARYPTSFYRLKISTNKEHRGEKHSKNSLRKKPQNI